MDFSIEFLRKESENRGARNRGIILSLAREVRFKANEAAHEM